jgi:TonB family protein
MKNKKLISTEELKKYASGKLLDKDANRVERSLLDQPLYADAVEGFEVIEQDKIDTNSVNIDLKNRLRERVQADKITHRPTKIIPIWQPISIAASVLLLIGLGFYLFNKNIDNQSVSINNPKSEKAKIASTQPLADSSFVDSREQSILSKSKKIDANNKEGDLKPITEIEANIISEKKTEIEKEDLALNETPPPPPSAAPIEKPKQSEVRSREIVADKEIAKEESAEATPPPSEASNAGKLGGSTITGTVVDADKEPMQGVAIYLKGTTKSARTDEKGRFYIDGLRKGNALVLNFNDLPTQEFIVNNPTIGQIIYSENPNSKFEPKITKKADPFNSNDFIDAKPEFGWAMYQDYLKENTKFPQQAIEKGIKGRVNVRFKINEEGQLSDFKITKSLGFGCDEEAIRVISAGPKWFPAFRYGKKTVSTATVTIKFEHD